MDAGVVENIKERHRSEEFDAEKALENLVVGTASVTGERFFPALVTHIAESFGVDFVSISRHEKEHIRFLAMSIDGNLHGEEIRPRRGGGCCECTLHEGSVYCVSSLSDCDRDCQAMAGEDINVSLSVALHSPQGEAIGALCIGNRTPLADVRWFKKILNIFAARASAELSRYESAERIAILNIELESRIQARTSELRERELQLMDFFENAHDLIQIVSLESYSFLFVNRAWRERLGYSEEEAREFGFCHIVHREHVSELDGWIERVIEGKEKGSKRFELTLITKSGEHVLVEGSLDCQMVDGKALTLRGIFRDVTKTKRVEQNLKRLFVAIESAVDGVAIFEEGKFVYLNQAHIDLFGYQKAEDLLGHSWRVLYGEDEIGRFERMILPRAEARGFWSGEAVGLKKDGTSFSEGLSLTILDGGVIVCVCRDISQRKRYELQLRDTNAALARATRLKDEFLANMSHELRTPLTAILGMSEGMLDSVFGSINDRQRKAVKSIERGGRHLLNLINDILDLSKIESGRLDLELSKVPILNVCSASLSFVRQMAFHKEIQLELDLPDSLRRVKLMIDDRRIQQALINLLSNAVKFTPRGGKVKLVVEQFEGATTPTRPGTASTFTDGIRFSVLDTGIGIAEHDLHRLFETFTQIDSKLSRQYTGSGLGLALVRKLVELHHGEVEVESELGEGSRFSLVFPSELIVDENDTAPHQSYRQKLQPANGRVLIVDDSTEFVQQITYYLAEMNCQCTILSNGSNVLSSIQLLQPSLVILDIQLPDISGWEVLKRIRTHSLYRSLPVLVASVVDDAKRARSLGAQGFLLKPFSRGYFVSVYNDVMGSRETPADGVEVVPREGKGKGRLLLVDDNKDNIESTTAYLEGSGFDVDIAMSGLRAIEMVRDNKPDLVLMDIQMPGMDGLTATRMIRQRLKGERLPIIALTALAMPGDRERCLEAGADDYVAKPVSMKELIKRIEGFLDGAESP